MRYAQDPYKETVKRVLQQYDTFRVKLEGAYAATLAQTAPDLTTRPYLVVASPSYDPITG